MSGSRMECCVVAEHGTGHSVRDDDLLGPGIVFCTQPRNVYSESAERSGHLFRTPAAYSVAVQLYPHAELGEHGREVRRLCTVLAEIILHAYALNIGAMTAKPDLPDQGTRIQGTFA